VEHRDAYRVRAAHIIQLVGQFEKTISLLLSMNTLKASASTVGAGNVQHEAIFNLAQLHRGHGYAAVYGIEQVDRTNEIAQYIFMF
jgi:alkylation response protein AidB-like acyl-CoA dehydrogenase